jgi:hypothetical protein
MRDEASQQCDDKGRIESRGEVVRACAIHIDQQVE